VKTRLALLAGLRRAPPPWAPPRPVMVEMFTSQACSSCPPADSLLRRLAAAHPGLLALDLHVTYWNGAAYRDPYALVAATARQNWYAGLAGASEVYTPEAVLFGYDPVHTTKVGGGENAGATLTEIDVVRSITRLGRWRGAARTLVVPRPAGARFAVLVQAANGAMLGVGRQPRRAPAAR
jgi:hypothetical protein